MGCRGGVRVVADASGHTDDDPVVSVPTTGLRVGGPTTGLCWRSDRPWLGLQGAAADCRQITDRPDLADRAIFLTLEPIPNDKRKLEAEMWAAFEVVRPRILGALLDAVATGLKRSPEIRLKRLPRMADFAIWATACETALRHDGTCWAEGTFVKVYDDNIDEAVETVLNANLVATAVRTFMADRKEWSGTATDLLELLGKVAGDIAIKAKPGRPTPRGSAASCGRRRPSCG